MVKKGFELQFHWIFILIAGGIILAFFFSIAMKQRGVSQERLELTLATDIEEIFTGAIISRGTAQRLPVPPQGIAFECNEFCDCNFRIDRAQKPFGSNALFAPGLLSERDITVWSNEFKTPYRVANFLYLTNPNHAYIFVESDDFQSKNLLSQLTNNIPPLISYETISRSDLATFQPGDFEHVKFIFLYEQPSTIRQLQLPAAFRRQEFSAINIGETSVSFYSKQRNRFIQRDIVSYIGLPSLFAAIFAEDNHMYRCGLKNTFGKLSYLSHLYAERARELQDHALAEEKTGCNYGAGLQSNTNICDNALSGTPIARLCEQHALALQLAQTLDQQAIIRLNSLKSQLEADNRNYIRQSCPEMF